MRKTALVLGTVAVLAVAASAPAEARGGFGPGIVGGLAAGAILGGIAANSYGYGPYGYGYGPYYGYRPAYYRPGPYAYYGPRYYGWHRGWRHRW
jgi:hypothetical protein